MRAILHKIRADFAELRNQESPLKAVAGLIASEHAEPARLGLAVWVGVTVGMTPFFGLHLAICIALALGLRLNKALTYAAANVSIPPMIPLIAVASVQVGEWALHGRWLSLDTYSVTELRGSFFLLWLLGALINGLILGGVLGLGVWAFAARRQRLRLQGAAELVPASSLEQLFQAFLPEGRIAAEIVRGKALHDVAYKTVLGETAGLPLSRLLDVGGGCGALALLLGLEKSSLRDGLVLDWDEPKLAQGARVAQRLGLPLRFKQGNAFALASLTDEGAFDCITCIDLLHYASLAEQTALVALLAGKLAPGGSLIIRDMNADRPVRTFFTLIQERLCLFFGRTRAQTLVARSGAALTAQLESLGLRVKSRSCHGKTPFSNMLWIATCAANP